MSSKQTNHLKLHSWNPTDRFTRTEFNENFEAIDAAWEKLDSRVAAETADRKAADNTLQTNINAKADATALAAETTNRTNADNNLQTQINQRPTVTVSTYTGTCPSGVTQGQFIRLGFRPKVVYVRALNNVNDGKTNSAMGVDGYQTKYKGAPEVTIADEGFGVTTSTGDFHLNDKGVEYFYVVLA